MKQPSEAELLRIFVGESDKHEGRPLYQVVVRKHAARGWRAAPCLRLPRFRRP